MTDAEYETLEGFDTESESEFAERRRNVRRPSSRPSFQPRPSPSYVTQAQLEAALARVDGKIKTVADSTTGINARVNTIASAAKKENDDRKKELETQKRDINGKLQLLALLPLLAKPKTIDLKAGDTVGSATLTADTKFATASDDTLTALLPLFLIGGLGGASGGLGMGGSESSGDSSMLMLALVLALGK